MVVSTQTRLSLSKTSQCFPAHHVAPATTEVTLLYYDLKVVPEYDRVFGRMSRKHVAQIFHDDVSIIVCFEEPISVVQMVFKYVIKCSHAFGSEVLSAKRCIESHCWEVRIFQVTQEVRSLM